MYLHNINVLIRILKGASIEVVVGILPDKKKQNIHFKMIEKVDNQLIVGEFIPDLIILNNDLSNTDINILKDIKQEIYPPIVAGWDTRLKTNFFKYYEQYAESLSKRLNSDLWLLTAYYARAENIDFNDVDSINIIEEKTNILISKIKKKYLEYSIKKTPFVIIKPNNGTYGMGILSVHSSDIKRLINRKLRNKMSKLKNGKKLTDVIIQEGVYTEDVVDNSAAEPVMYAINNNLVGGFYRVNSLKNKNENLNSPNSTFMSIKHDYFIDKKISTMISSKRLYVYNIIMRLSILAATKELTN